MSAWLLFDQGVMGSTISYHNDGHSRKANVHHQVLVVTWLSADLSIQQVHFLNRVVIGKIQFVRAITHYAIFGRSLVFL